MFVAPIDSDEYRTCGTCGERKAHNMFYRDGNNKDGSPKFRRDCKDCYRKTRMSERKVKRNVKQIGRTNKSKK